MVMTTIASETFPTFSTSKRSVAVMANDSQLSFTNKKGLLDMNNPAQKMMSIFMKKNNQRIQMQQSVMDAAKDSQNLDSSENGSSRRQTQLTLARLVSKRQWFEIENILSTSSVEWTVIDEKGRVTEDNILHFACSFRAPLRIVKLLAMRYTRSLNLPDSSGRFPIHVASKYSAMPDVIQYLVNENPDVAGIQDDFGKTPIHYVAEFYGKRHDPLAAMQVHDNMLQVVRTLRAAAPKSFNLEDLEGYNAIELAIENDADIKVVKAMQRSSRDDWREMKAKHGKTHDEITKDLERDASEKRLSFMCDNSLGQGMLSSRRSIRSSGIERDNVDPANAPQIKSFVAKSA